MVDPEPEAVNAPPASENYCPPPPSLALDALTDPEIGDHVVDPEPEAVNAPPASEPDASPTHCAGTGRCAVPGTGDVASH